MADTRPADSTVVLGDYLYVASLTSPGKIVKFDLATFQEVATLELPGFLEEVVGEVKQQTTEMRVMDGIPERVKALIEVVQKIGGKP